jgi:hypothetical protein
MRRFLAWRRRRRLLGHGRRDPGGEREGGQGGGAGPAGAAVEAVGVQGVHGDIRLL